MKRDIEKYGYCYIQHTSDTRQMARKQKSAEKEKNRDKLHYNIFGYFSRKEYEYEEIEKSEEKYDICYYPIIDDVSDDCIIEIDRLCAGRRIEYIGGTHEPNQRYDDHEESKVFDAMHIICICDGKYNTEILEKRLIKHYNPPNNKNVGGGGLLDKVNYIYVLFD
jgi:hypothetical protein